MVIKYLPCLFKGKKYYSYLGSGIQDGKKKSDPESGINIRDPPHWEK
jgi:hypothetical protein